MPDRKPELGRIPDQGLSTPTPNERGSERFPWRTFGLLSAIGYTGLASGLFLGFAIFDPLGPHVTSLTELLTEILPRAQAASLVAVSVTAVSLYLGNKIVMRRFNSV